MRASDYGRADAILTLTRESGGRPVVFVDEQAAYILDLELELERERQPLQDLLTAEQAKSSERELARIERWNRSVRVYWAAIVAAAIVGSTSGWWLKVFFDRLHL